LRKNKVSRVVSIALCIALMLSMFPTIVFANDAFEITVSASAATAEAGDTITVDIMLDANVTGGFGSLQVEIGYDDTVLSRVSKASGTLMPALAPPPMTVANPFSYSLVASFPETITDTGTILTIVFDVLDDAPLGLSPITVNVLLGNRLDPVSFLPVNIPTMGINGSVNVTDGQVVTTFGLNPATTSLTTNAPVNIGTTGNATGTITVNAAQVADLLDDHDVEVSVSAAGVITVEFVGAMPTAANPAGITSGPHSVVFTRGGVNATLTINVAIPAYGVVDTPITGRAITITPANAMGPTGAPRGGTPMANVNFNLPNTTSAVTWLRNGTAATGNFVGGSTYTAQITLTPAAGHVFNLTGADAFTVPGATSVSHVVNANGSVTVTAVFPPAVYAPVHTGVADITWVATAMVGFVGLSAALWVYVVVARTKKQGA
jgi:hypothetical protein